MTRFAVLSLRGATVSALLLALVISGGCRRKKYENPITKDTQQPDKVLFDKAINDIEKGRYEIARLTLNTLMNTYDTSEFMAKAKLAIADSWMREGGSNGWAQAEAEYKDFILFYPTLDESSEAQMKICDIHFKQMEKPDRDPMHANRAEEECRTVLTQFPNSRFAPMAAQRLRQIQEVVSDSEYRVGSYYHHKGSFFAAANRLQNVTDHYPLYSGADAALMKLGESYEKLGPRFRERAVQAYQKLAREYPLSASLEDAKNRLKALEAEIPEPDPVAYARMKYELENVTEPGTLSKMWGVFSKSPDVSKAAKSGQPTMTSLRPTIPLGVPIPGAAGGPGGVTDVTVSTATTADSTALDTQPDARQSQQNQPADGAKAAPTQGAATDGQPASTNGGKTGDKKKQDEKKKK